MTRSMDHRATKSALGPVAVLLPMLLASGAQAAFIGPQLPYLEFGLLTNPGGLCASTATINGFVYLHNRDPGVGLIPGAGKEGELSSSRDALANGWTFEGEKRAGMGASAGPCIANEQSIWEAKAHWTDDFGPPDGLPLSGMVHESEDKIKDWFDGQFLTSGFPTWDFLLDSLIRKEAVELVLRGTAFAHAVTLTSLQWDDTNSNGVWNGTEARKIDFLDPNNTLALFDATLTLANDGSLNFRWNNGVDPPKNVSITAAYAEDISEPRTILLFLFAVFWVVGRTQFGRPPRGHELARFFNRG